MTYTIRYFLIFTVSSALFLTSCSEDIITEPEENEETEDTVAVVYDVFELSIQVENNKPVTSKDPADYLSCTIKANGMGIEDDYQGTGRIRGRGNSSWLWYDKKPYRIKLDESSEMLGLKKNRDWVLLANYRDPTNLMNTFGFEAAHWLGLPYTNHTRYVEVTLNGDYIGLYQLTEQVEEGGNRVAIDENEGWLICLDADDGPELSPGAGDNFWSEVFSLPICVKYPEDPTSGQLNIIKEDFALLEDAVDAHNYDDVAALLDIASFINFMILQELVYNVEVDAPRSMFMHKDKGGKYVMGPVWDFDAGFDFDWFTMYTGHNYFMEQELVLGTNPARHTNGYWVSDFFTEMFKNEQFVEEYQQRWNEIKDDIVTQNWAVMEDYVIALQDAMARDAERWPIDKDYNTEIGKMKNWMKNRVTYLNKVINNYP